MSIQIETITFNHDPNRLNSDALNLRRNSTALLRVPEWRRGVTLAPEQSVAAYAIRETTGQAVTVQARFTSSTPGVTAVVRAVDANAPPSNVLGEVAERPVVFDPGGQSQPETFRLINTRLAGAGVGTHVVGWRWQARVPPSPDFADIGVTFHKIYTVLEEPKSPWQQSPLAPSNLQLPWLDVLDWACLWARGARDVHEAAELITRSVYALGDNLLRYHEHGGKAHYIKGDDFYCEHFLRLLRGEEPHLGQEVNCNDTATVVSTFANILGCDLSQARMGGAGFDLNLIQPIGFSQWSPNFGFGRYRYHEVAWTGGGTSADNVYDACLRLDSDTDPFAAPHAPLLAINLRFGEPGQGLYRDKLARNTADGRPSCSPIPGSAKRRQMRDPALPAPQPFAGVMLESLALDLRFDEWRSFKSLPDDLLIWNFKLLDEALPEWQLAETLEGVARDGSFRSIETLWTSPTRGRRSLLSVDVYECPSLEAAHEQLVKLLADISLPAVPLFGGGLGDVAFAAPSRTMILFARGNLAVSVCDASREQQPVVDVASCLDRLLTGKPDGAEDFGNAPPAALTREGAATDPGEVKSVPLLPNPPPWGDQRAWYKFFSPSGGIQLVRGWPHYLPRGGGEQEVSAFAIAPEGRVAGGKLKFTL